MKLTKFTFKTGNSRRYNDGIRKRDNLQDFEVLEVRVGDVVDAIETIRSQHSDITDNQTITDVSNSAAVVTVSDTSTELRYAEPG